MIATTSETPVTETPVQPAVPASAMNRPIAANMIGVDLTIRRPGGRIQLKQVEVEAATQTGDIEKIDLDKVTRPQFIIDSPSDHPFWKEVDETAAEADLVLRKFSVSDAKRGFHLVPMGRSGDLVAALRDVRNKRLALVRDFAENHWQEYVQNLRNKFNGHFYLLEPRLPDPRLLVEKFDLLWFLTPLTPINAENLRFTDMNEHDRQAIIDESNRMAQEMINQRASVIYEQVFGELLVKCDDIANGAFETGKRKFGAITELVDMIERLKTFGEYCSNPTVMQHANATMAVLKNIKDISQVNTNAGQNEVQKAMKAAFKPLGDAIDAMLNEVSPKAGRAGRHVGV